MARRDETMENDRTDSKEVPDRPFKNIEVIDNLSHQVCKVACMSCIRGHRTTACGIKSCRSKVFWTVKKPGRPSNSCTCAYRQAGGCKCNIARNQCTHKPKKGEKRSPECRCDENGRYCCLLAEEAWPVLQAGGKPSVQFYPNPESIPSDTPNAVPEPPAFNSSIFSTLPANAMVNTRLGVVMMPPSPLEHPVPQHNATLPMVHDTNFSEFVSNYNSYLIPSAMCQQCGRLGCQCSACPPQMQQQSTSHWGTFCGSGAGQQMQQQPSMFNQQPVFTPPPAPLQPNVSSYEQPQQPSAGACCFGDMSELEEMDWGFGADMGLGDMGMGDMGL